MLEDAETEGRIFDDEAMKEAPKQVAAVVSYHKAQLLR